MSEYMELGVVIAIVGVAALYVGRRLFGKNADAGCGCGCGSDCPSAGGCCGGSQGGTIGECVPKDCGGSKDA